MFEWSATTWGDIISLEYGKALRSHGGNGRVRVYGSNGPIGWTDKALADGPAVILGRKGAYRGVEYSPGPFHVIDTAYFVVPKAELDVRWLFYAIKYHKLGEIDDGSPIPSTTRAAVYVRELDLPSLREQQEMASVLSALDDKIELNRQMSETLEAVAQAIFRDWLVDFGPVRRKLAGETDPVAIMGGLTPDPARAAELAMLFPAELSDSDLPQGWIERPLDQIAEFLNGLALQKFPAVEGEPSLPVIKIAELRNGLTDKSNRASPKLPDKYIVRDGDYLFSWSGSLMAKVWTEGDGALNQHLFKVSSTTYPQWFFAAWVEHHLPEFQRIAASKATTMGHIQRGHLTSAMTACPPRPTLEVMATVLAPLWDGRIHNDLENRSLAETRDYLLPRLMSGGVRAGDAAKLAQEAAG